MWFVFSSSLDMRGDNICQYGEELGRIKKQKKDEKKPARVTPDWLDLNAATTSGNHEVSCRWLPTSLCRRGVW